MESLAHLVKGCLGTGVLALPKGYAATGLISGIIIMMIVSVIITHCMRVLIQQEYHQAKLSRVPYLPYRDAAASSLRRGPESLRKFAKCFAIAVDFFLGLYHLGACTVYVLYISNTLLKIFASTSNFQVTIYILIIALPLTAVTLIPNLKLLAPFSMLANALTIVGLILVNYFVIGTPKKDTSPMNLWGNIQHYPTFFGTVLFAVAAVGVLVAIENNMKNPEKFAPPLGVLNVGMFIVIGLYFITSLSGYNYCRDKCSDMLTDDLPPGSWLATSVLVMYVIAIFISFPLNCYVPVEIICRYIQRSLAPESEKKMFLIEMIVRICCTAFCVILAAILPDIGLFISLFGALCLSNMGIIFPMMMEAFTGPKWYVIVKDVFIMLVGVGVLISGTYTELVKVVNYFSK